MASASEWFRKHGAQLALAEKELGQGEGGGQKTVALYTEMLSAEAVQTCRGHEDAATFPLCLCALPPATVAQARAIEYLKLDKAVTVVFLMETSGRPQLEPVELRCICNHTYRADPSSLTYRKFMFLLTDLKYKTAAVHNLLGSLLPEPQPAEQRKSPSAAASDLSAVPAIEAQLASCIEQESNPVIKDFLEQLTTNRRLTPANCEVYNYLLKHTRRRGPAESSH